MDQIKQIAKVVKEYFEANLSINIIPAKDLMPQFIRACIFEKDEKKGLPIRKILRKLDQENQLHLIPFVLADRKVVNTNWFFGRNVQAKTAATIRPKLMAIQKAEPAKISRTDSDEYYVLFLCDEVLGRIGIRQKRFDFLRGDTGVKLPVDIYYSELNLVIEYREYQHTNSVRHFDKPNILTKSGVHRGEQRKIYDQRRRDVLPQNGICLIEISYTDFGYDKRNRIVKDKERDLKVVLHLFQNIKA